MLRLALMAADLSQSEIGMSGQGSIATERGEDNDHASFKPPLLRSFCTHPRAYGFKLGIGPGRRREAQGQRADRGHRDPYDDAIKSATGLELTLRETPQSITILNRDRIEQFALTSFSELIDQAVGVNVDRGETDRTVFNARGFEVTNFQVDGVGLPLISGIQYGDVDTFLFEQIEIVRGANGLVTGVGNPSATINYVRKRPLREFSVNGAAYAGSYGRLRGEIDVSVPLDSDGNVRARLIGAHEDRDGHLDFYHLNRIVLGGLIAADITPDLTATVGYMWQRNKTRGSSWGSTIQFYSDGTRIDNDRSANFAPEWADWPVIDQQLFSELELKIGNGWSAKAVATYSRFQESPTIVYPFGFPDRTTGLDIYGYTADYESDYKRYYGDFYASGPFNLFGREHQLTFGASYSRSDGLQWEGEGLAEFGAIFAYPDFRTLDTAGSIPRPDYSPRGLQLDVREELTRYYTAAQINVADPLKFVVGASYAKLTTSGTSYGTDQTRSDGEISPYAGVLFDIIPQMTLYASYTSIFNPQREEDIDRNRLDPIHGTNIEVGVKNEWFDSKLYASAVLFWTKQSNLAQFAGTIVDPEDGLYNYYEGVDTKSNGWEIEVAGKVTDNFEISGGFTKLEIRSHTGDLLRTYVPRETLKLAATYNVPDLNNLSLGTQLRWQSGTYGDVGGLFDVNEDQVVFRQPTYTVIDLAASVDLTKGLKASINVKNVTDKKYFYSLVYAEVGEALYAPGRNVTASISFRF